MILLGITKKLFWPIFALEKINIIGINLTDFLSISMLFRLLCKLSKRLSLHYSPFFGDIS